MNEIIPTYEEYQAAKKIVDAFEREQKRLEQIKIDSLNGELKEYFKNNLIDSSYKLEEFQLRKEWLGYIEIIPIKPEMDEDYDGGNDKDIEEISNRYGLKCKFPSWVYHK